MYSLANVQKGEIFLYPLNCEPLRESRRFDEFISFENEDCTVKGGVDAKAMFKAIATKPGPSTIKLICSALR